MEFSNTFQDDLKKLMQWRRDVRRFRTDPVDEAVLTHCLDAFCLAPSVGLSEPWRIVRVNSDKARAAVLGNFQRANTQALKGYSGEKAEIYASLKLSGLVESPVQLAIFCDETTTKGAGLGAGTMPEMRRYSVVGAINHFWLAARACGLGVGWVSILHPAAVCRDLEVPEGWTLVSYLCVGWPQTRSETPELAKVGWEQRAKNLIIETR